MIELENMSVDELWTIYNKLGATLAVKLAAEKNVLEERLQQLQIEKRPTPVRRKYPPVFPKYRNPDMPSELWSGRGKQPRWVAEKLRLGKRMEDLRIAKPSSSFATTIKRGRRAES